MAEGRETTCPHGVEDMCFACLALRSAGRETTHEIADFHPATGHLHACTDRATCDCAAWLFCIAEDAVLSPPAREPG